MSGKKISSLARNSVVGIVLGASKVCVQLLALPIVANLLGPSEFAIYALAFPAVSFFLVLADAGINGTLAREEESNEQVWSTAFWAVFLLCLTLQIFVILLGIFIAFIAGEPRLKGLMFLLSFCLPLLGLTNVASARLYRRGRVQYLASSDAAATVIGVSFGIACAYEGLGAASLAVQLVMIFSARMLLVNIVAFRKPMLIFKFSDISRHAVASFTIVLSRLSEFAGRTLENVVFQKVFGLPSLGVYNLGNQIARFVCDAIGNPVWASLYAHALHTSHEDLRSLSVRTVSAVGYIVFPIAVLLMFSADPLFGILMSDRWHSAADVVELLIVFYGMSSVLGLVGAVLTAAGAPTAIFLANFILYLLRIFCVSLGGMLGFQVTVFFVAFATFAYVGILLFGARRSFGFRPVELSVPLCKALVSCTALSVVFGAMNLFLSSSLVFLVCKCAVSLAVYVCFLRVLGVEELSFVLSRLSSIRWNRT